MPMVPAQALNTSNPLGAPADPANFLIAAAEAGGDNARAMPVPRSRALGNPATRPKRRLPDIKVVK